MYTLEHNCKVYNFGRVHDEFIRLLVDNQKYVLNNDVDNTKRESSLSRDEDETEGYGEREYYDSNDEQEEVDDDDSEEDDDDYNEGEDG